MSDSVKKALASFLKACPVSAGEVVGVGVSGGADSVCLLRALVQAARQNGFEVRAVTVNHKLRPDADSEAKQVGVWAADLGISHDILVWKGKKPTARLEERAREKRYELMTAWCLQNGIQKLFLAHQAGDQAETFWARLARGSGVDGLGAMAPVRVQNGILLCRPFLGVSRQEMEEALRVAGIVWFEDEMNRDAAYERVRWRGRQAVLSDMGLTPGRIGLTAGRLRRARAALEYYTDEACRQVMKSHAEGYVTLDRRVFDMLPDEIRVRILMRVIRLVSGQGVELDQAEAWLSQDVARATLGNCYLIRQKTKIWVAPEYQRMPAPITVKAGQSVQWGRFLIDASVNVCVCVGKPEKHARRVPFLVRQAIPVLSADTDIDVLFRMQSEKGLENRGNLPYNKGNKPVVVMTWITA